MKTLFNPAGSIRRRLLWLLLIGAAVLSGLLYLSVSTVARSAVETTQDSILGAATIAIAEQLRGADDGVEVDIPYTAFSMLGAVGEDRVFYRILVNGETVTGYDDLPLPDTTPAGLTPRYYSHPYQDMMVRIAAVERPVLVSSRSVAVQVLVAQTRTAQDAIVGQMANRAAALGLGFFGVAAVLAVVTARSVVQPVNSLAEAMGRRGPQDLRPVTRPVPQELTPLVAALNGFISRLSGALTRTETFIAEAAHHIRTPLATLRAQAELALRQTDDDATRATLRGVIRSVDDSARSASQLLEHAAVVYRSDQRADDRIDLAALARDIGQSFGPTADLRDLTLAVHTPDSPVWLTADRLLVETALRNLVDNAIKYSNPDGQVSIDVDQSATHASVRVSDRGRGLDGARRSHLTARFQRGGNVGDVVGTGLGLTIVQEVARAQNGSFTLSDRTGGGTCAELSLPL